MRFFALKLLHLLTKITIDWFLLHITWHIAIFIMISKSTGLSHMKFNRLGNYQTKQNRALLLLYVDWYCIRSSPKIRSECARQVSHTSCLCNFNVACHKHNVAATWIIRYFNPPCKYFSKIIKKPPDRILRSMWDLSFITSFSHLISLMADLKFYTHRA